MIWGWLIPGWLRRGVLWVAGAALALLAAWGAGKREGRQTARRKAAEDALKRADKGRKAVADAKRRAEGGESPEEIARNHDGSWQ